MIIHMTLSDVISIVLGGLAFLYVIGCIIIAKICNYRSRKEKKHGKDIQK